MIIKNLRLVILTQRKIILKFKKTFRIKLSMNLSKTIKNFKINKTMINPKMKQLMKKKPIKIIKF